MTKRALRRLKGARRRVRNWHRSSRWSLHSVHQLEGTLVSRPKLNEALETNADAGAFDRSSSRFAVGDGVSQSFDPRAWSRLLVEHVCNGHSLDVKSLEQLSSLLQTAATDDEPWYLAEMRQRGSHTTLLWGHVTDHHSGTTINLSSVGDCCAFLTRQGRIVESWPFRHLDDFPGRPEAISSLPPYLPRSIASHKLDAQLGDRLLLATDAVARFIVAAHERDPMIQIGDLLPFISNEGLDGAEFELWANSARSDGSLEDDDLTVLHLTVCGVRRK